ncbi:MAG TPA: dihydropteroate synthase [Pseudogracilibacillus sp.]|nr:dihydropteroate synthase [Pseudogracilibacillus sp.]
MKIQLTSTTLDLSKKTQIMGILNVTPDSFSDGGKFNSVEAAIQQAQQMEEEGADIIDIGGESTRPDHAPISEEEEMKRVLPLIEAIKPKINIPISIDTYKANTAKKAIESGADIINDIWGAKKDPKMATIAAEKGVPIILMHNRNNKTYNSIIDDMIQDLIESVEIAKRAGVKDEQIILDPGIGFGKESKDNYTVLQQLHQLVDAFPYPFLLASSRKSFINQVLDMPAHERDNATGATTCLGIQQGAKIIRVHDVKRHVELARMTEAILGGAGSIG